MVLGVIDKSWMSSNNLHTYQNGVDAFLEYACDNWRTHALNPDAKIRIPCPCTRCLNCYEHKIRKVRYHLLNYGINPRYTKWTQHGEVDDSQHMGPGSSNGGQNTEEDGDWQMGIPTDAEETREMVEQLVDQDNFPKRKLEELIKDAENPLYEGDTKFTKMSSMCDLFNLKSKYGASDKLFNELLPLIKNMLPPGNQLISRVYEAKKMMRSMGSGYTKIHACPNDCILYRKQYKDEQTCPTCGESRWKVDDVTQEVHVKTPAKVLWYFDIIPRLKALFLSENKSKHLIWHKTGRKEEDGVMRHPADSPAWKEIDKEYPKFAKEARNLRLGISADGVDVNRGMHTRRSVWPVLTAIYNLPPWLCMKRKFIMLSLLIDGGPCQDIDVMLEPLVEDLKLLWEKGVECFDAHTQEYFTLHAVVLWTINDYPALGTLQGCPYSGKKGCVVCREKTSHISLKSSRKVVYTGHRRFLPPKHPFRYQKDFNGEEEHDSVDEPLTGEEIYEQVKTIKNSWGKAKKNIKVVFVEKLGKDGKMKLIRTEKTIDQPKEKSNGDEEDDDYWKKFNIWQRLLPYWRYLKVHHCIDFMHVEKNVCDSIVGTLLNDGRSKDHINARMDLVHQGLRPELHPTPDGKGGFTIPAGTFTLSKEEKDKLCGSLAGIRAPQGYCSNFSKLVSLKDRKLIGLKSHDCHMLMQQFLPVAIKSIMPRPTRNAIIRLCYFFRAISSKVIKVDELDKLEEEHCVTLCLLEKYFPPSLFDIMVHLTVHLTREVRQCGPVCFRWMYPFERYMKVIKGHVRNKNKPGGSIAEANVTEETVELFGDFRSCMKTVGIPPDEHNTPDDGEDCNFFEGIPKSGGRLENVDPDLWEEAHTYVLRNTLEVEPYIDLHKAYIKGEYPKAEDNWVHKHHCENFGHWLNNEVERQLQVSRESISDTLRWLAKYPSPDVKKYEKLQINGYLFRTKSHDGTVNQNSGVHVKANEENFRRSDSTFDKADYYGVLQEIWVLDYHSLQIPIFKCDWVDKKKGVSNDRLGYTLVDLNNMSKKEPFIFASQAIQVFYVRDQGDKKKSIVLAMPPKNYVDTYDEEYSTGERDEEYNTVTFPRNEYNLPPVDPLDLGKVSKTTKCRPEIRGRVVRKAKA